MSTTFISKRSELLEARGITGRTKKVIETAAGLAVFPSLTSSG
jgi:hypothetical protein